MKSLPLVITAVLILTLGIAGCSQIQTQTPETYTPPTPPNFTAQQAIGLVNSATSASTPTIRAASNYFRPKFNYSTRQWMIEVWSSENASKQYAGMVYIVDDATGKVLNPPPVYNPQTTQTTPTAQPTLTTPTAPNAPTTAPTPTPTYTLFVGVVPLGAGSVSPSSGTYQSGRQLTLTATPASGYVFDYWGGDGTGASPTVIVTMNSNKSVFARFKAIATPTTTYATWIDVYQATYGELPVVPDWMLSLLPELKAGDRIRKGVTLIPASMQYWARRSPTEKDMVWELWAWLGYYPVEWLWQADKSRPPDPTRDIFYR